MPEAQPPVSRDSGPTPSDRLPDEVVTCLQNARFLHLATCTSNEPHVSLMNYTYLPPSVRPPAEAATANSNSTSNSTSQSTSSQSLLPPGPTIIMTSNPRSKKTTNLLANPNVSLLVHDWVSARPPAAPSIPGAGARDRSPDPSGGGSRRGQSTLAGMLMQMNAAAMSSISATMNGYAHVLPVGTPEERWCKARHLANNTFGDEDENAVQEGEGDGSQAGDPTRLGAGGTVGSGFRRPAEQRRLSLAHSEREGDGGRESYIRDEEARVVVVELKDGRISDWKGGVKDWVIRGAGEGRLVNGV